MQGANKKNIYIHIFVKVQIIIIIMERVMYNFGESIMERVKNTNIVHTVRI